MVPELVTGLGAFKTMLDMAKGLKDINDATVRNGAVIELQEKIFAAQQAQAALIQLVRDLEEKVAGFEKWNAEENRYQLTDYGGRTFAYELKVAMSNGEPPHRICAQCFQHKQKSILQFQGNTRGQDHYQCPACNKEISFGIRTPPERQSSAGSNWIV